MQHSDCNADEHTYGNVNADTYTDEHADGIADGITHYVDPIQFGYVY